MKNIRNIIFCALFLLTLSVHAADFGFITSQYAEYGDLDFYYRGKFMPRLSLPVGEGRLIISAQVTMEKGDEFSWVPELLHTELFLRFGASNLKLGRMFYSSPIPFILEGYFDGVKFSHNTSAGTFSAGAWYTGFLYKETANINMTRSDQVVTGAVFDLNDFANTYFAPKRVIASLDWEHPSVGEFLQLKAALTGQFDLSDSDEKYNSGYITLNAGIPVKSVLFNLGGSFEIAQSESAAEESHINAAYAGTLGIFWTLPSNFNSRLSLSGHFIGGRTNDFNRAFVPITTKYYGNIFQPNLSGISILGLGYDARLTSSLGLNLTALHFVRNDLGTFYGYPVSVDSEGYFLGTEFFARLIWSPVSDLQFNFGGGTFFPSLGNAGPDEGLQWRAGLIIVITLY